MGGPRPALWRALVLAGLVRLQVCDARRFRQRRALVRAAIEEREELAVDMKDDDLAPPDGDDLVAARRDIGGLGDDVARHSHTQPSL